MTTFANRKLFFRCAALPVAALIAAPQARAQITTLPVPDALANLDARVTLDSGRITVLDGQVADLTKTVQNTAQAVDTLTDRVTDNTQRISVLDGRVTDHDAHLGLLDDQVQLNTNAIGTANGRIDDNAAAIQDLDGRVTTSTQNIAANTRDIATNRNAIADANARIDLNTAALSGLDDRVTTDEGRTADNTAAIAANGAADAVRDTRIAANTTAIDDLDGRVTANTDAIAANNVRDDAQDVRITANTNANTRQDAELASQSSRIDATNTIAVAARADAADLRAGVEAGTVGLVRQAGPSAPVTIAAQTGGTVVTVSGTDGDRRVSGVADGVASNDAATVGQVARTASDTLAAANSYTDNSISTIMQQQTINFEQVIRQNNVTLRRDMDSIGAGSAAIAGLPQAIIPGAGMVGASIGGHGSQVAFAMGLSKAFDGDHAPVLKAGAAFDARRGEVTYNAGVGFHF